MCQTERPTTTTLPRKGHVMADSIPTPTHPRFQDLRGQTFGKLAVTEYLGQVDGGSTSLWFCRCECGGTSVVRSQNLKSGTTRGCGCLRRSDLTGKTFGRLFVVSFAWMERSKSYWLCRCQCGKGTVVQGQSLINQHTRSCGCLRSDEVSERMFEDLLGRRFGRLVVIECAGQAKKDGNYRWKCRCNCGNEKIVLASNLKTGRVSGCGCVSIKHARTNSLEWRSWTSMKARCSNPNVYSYERYGGRGITVCERWLGKDGFKNFLADMGNRPSPEHTLDRIDSNGNYEPGNCRWATKIEQATNRRNTVMVTCNGETLSVEGWGRRNGIQSGTIRRRISKGMALEDAVSLPVRGRLSDYRHDAGIS